MHRLSQSQSPCITFVYSFCYRTVIPPRSTHPALPCKLVLFCFCTPPHLSNSRQGRSSLCWVSLYDRSQWFQSLLWDISIPSQHLWPQKNGLVTCPPLFARSFIPFDLFHHPVICHYTLFTATATLHDLSVKHSLSQRIA